VISKKQITPRSI